VAEYLPSKCRALSSIPQYCQKQNKTVLYKWNHTAYNLLGLAFGTWHHSLKGHPGSCVDQCSAPSLLSSVLWGKEAQEWNPGSYGHSVFSFISNCQTSPACLHHCTQQDFFWVRISLCNSGKLFTLLPLPSIAEITAVWYHIPPTKHLKILFKNMWPPVYKTLI
jgi:hypothetical protein